MLVEVWTHFRENFENLIKLEMSGKIAHKKCGANDRANQL